LRQYLAILTENNKMKYLYINKACDMPQNGFQSHSGDIFTKRLTGSSSLSVSNIIKVAGHHCGIVLDAPANS